MYQTPMNNKKKDMKQIKLEKPNTKPEKQFVPLSGKTCIIKSVVSVLL